MLLNRCVIPAAGMGTRFLPATKSMPKEMLPALDRPVIQSVVEEALASGLDQVLIVTGRGKRAIEDHFDHTGELEAIAKGEGLAHLQALNDLGAQASIHYVRQPQPRGLADAVYRARHFCGHEPFVVLLGDTIFTPPPARNSLTGKSPTCQLVEAFEAVGDPVVSVERVRRSKIKDYGIVKIAGNPSPLPQASGYASRLHPILGLVEKSDPAEAPSDLGIVGAYALTPDIFEAIEKTPPGKNGEVQLTDALRILLKKRPIYAFEFEGRRLDIGTKQDWMRANLILGLEQEPWRSTIEEVISEHPEGQRIARRIVDTRRSQVAARERRGKTRQR